MIQVSLHNLCIIYLSLMLVGIFFVGIYRHFKTKDYRNVDDSKLHICEFCQYAYIDKSEKIITKCPQCDLLNDPKHALQ